MFTRKIVPRYLLLLHRHSGVWHPGIVKGLVPAHYRPRLLLLLLLLYHLVPDSLEVVGLLLLLWHLLHSARSCNIIIVKVVLVNQVTVISLQSITSLVLPLQELPTRGTLNFKSSRETCVILTAQIRIVDAAQPEALRLNSYLD